MLLAANPSRIRQFEDNDANELKCLLDFKLKVILYNIPFLLYNLINLCLSLTNESATAVVL